MKVLAISNYDRAAIHDVRPEAEMLIGLKRQGVDLEVMTKASSYYAGRMREAGIRIHDHLPQRKLSLTSMRVIRKVLREGAHDIVHLFNKKAIVNGLFACSGLPVHVITYRGQTGNISRYDPSCYLAHLHPRVERIVCVSEAVRQSLIREVRDPEMLVTIYKGHDLAWYADIDTLPRSALGVPEDSVLAVCVANNRPRKGVPVLLEAMAQLGDLSNLHLILVGRGMTSQPIRDTVARLPHPSHVHLYDYRPDVLAVVKACDLSILPATRREGLPKTVIEAMALGVAPVVTRTGGSPELVLDGQTGLVVAPGDAKALAEAMRSLATDRSLLRQFGAASRDRLRTHFNIQDSITQHLALYESLVSTRPTIAA